ncbi:NACHT domain-containing protein [Micromonospora sp. RHAY321]|uniref:NACHT domain-containing protein n=1 Tax=Micromonospora sp. RHAY321 TaxID=2944807 RepID=UPI00207D0A11|nr:NACHT domain-containing protein [Micromonospora sp. RHAY321]MCO1594860.1 NACHT domain-containing protein [Micromonospora sp. RHAY321]
MRRPMWKWGLLTVVAALAAGGTGWVWLRYDFEKVNWAWGVIAGIIAVYVVLDQVFTNRPAASMALVTHRRAAADQLADLIRRDPTDDTLLRAIDEPYPLPVRWSTGPARLLPSWRAIGRSSDAAPLDLSGRDGALWSRYRSIPSGRLLLLGRAGSGKSITALRMARELPAHRDPDTPVPVPLPVASWDPDREGFTDWLVDRIARRYPQLAAERPDREAVLRDLVEADLVVPVLDGLDEMPEQRLIACLEQLNALATQRFVLTCRSSVYERYLTQGEKLRGAAVVVLEPLSPAEVADYLVDAAPYHQAENWSTVAATIGDDTELTDVLSTPLMVAMARTAFDQPGTDPRDLVPLAREQGSRSVEDDLLTRAVDAALRSGRGGQGLHRWEPDTSRRYLAFLAAHLESLDQREFRWWQLPAALPGPFWAIFDGLRTGLAAWVALTYAHDALTATAAVTSEPGIRDLLNAIARNPDGLGVAAFLLAGCAAMLRGGTARDTPRRVLFAGGRWALRDGMIGGLVGGTFWAFVTLTLLSTVTPSPELVEWLDRVPGLPPWSVPVRAAVLVGVLWWVYFAVTAGLRVDVAAPAAELGATSAAETIDADRAASVAAALTTVAAAVLGVFVAVALLRLTGVLPAAPSVTSLAYAGMGLGLGWWLHRRAGAAWVRFAVARAVLAVRGRIPFPLLAFLAYVESVGLLRHGAGAYRFRHGRLQSRLAAGSLTGRRGSRLREEFGIELARAGYWTEALGAFAAVARTRAASIGSVDRLTVAALRKALLAGAAAGQWTRLADLLALMPAPSPPGTTTPVSEQRERIARLLVADTSLPELRAAAEELRRREDDDTRTDTGTDEFLAALHYAEGGPDAARALLDRLLGSGSAGDGFGRSVPLAAGLLARLLLDDGDAEAALAVCHHELLLTDQAPDRADLLLLQTWSWSVEVLRRVTDEHGDLLRRIRAALAEQRGRRFALTRREFAEMGLQMCHATVGHATLGPLAVAVSRRLVGVLADPEIVVLTARRGAPIWHAG